MKNYTDFFPSRADAAIELVDSLSSNTSADSVVKLSLNPLFRRQYSSITDTIDNLHLHEAAHCEKLLSLLLAYCPKPERKSYYLLGMDCTAYPRPYAATLPDRGYAHSNNATPGQRPVSIGHEYSLLALLPEKPQGGTPPWVYPLSIQRVPTDEVGTEVGLKQLQAVSDALEDQLCVSVADAAYSCKSNLLKANTINNLVYISRLRSNGYLYQPANNTAHKKKGRGHPTWYGASFRLNDASTWILPDETMIVPWKTAKGRQLQAHIKGWNHLLSKGKKGTDMHNVPLRVLQITVKDAQGKQIYKRPLWLVVTGKQRDVLSLQDIWEAYRQRFDVEHFFRFGKRRLLLVGYQTTEIAHEETFSILAMLSYVQLYLARDVAQSQVYSWERYAHQLTAKPTNTKPLSPSQVQRDYARIVSNVVGTPASAPKQRGIPKGRAVGATQPARVKLAVVKKTQPSAESQKTPNIEKAIKQLGKGVNEIKSAIEQSPKCLKRALKSLNKEIFNASTQKLAETFLATVMQKKLVTQNAENTREPPS